MTSFLRDYRNILLSPLMFAADGVVVRVELLPGPASRPPAPPAGSRLCWVEAGPQS